MSIAKAIERDILRERPRLPTTPTCFACGRAYMRGALKGDGSAPSRFCSTRCRDAFDNGFPPYDPDPLRTMMRSGKPWVVVAGPPGTVGQPWPRDLPVSGDGCLIPCAGCHKQFSSRGLRCCSTDCERQYRERLDIEATLQEVGAEISPKRTCETCGATIPRWKNGRAVSKTTRFCSAKCSRKARKHPGTTLRPDVVDNAKKPLQNGPSQEPDQFCPTSARQPSDPTGPGPSAVRLPIDLVPRHSDFDSLAESFG
jgi:hypothetical protein